MFRQCCNDDTVSQHLAKRIVRSVMMTIPSGMADSGGESVETVVLTDPPAPSPSSTGSRTGSDGDDFALYARWSVQTGSSISKGPSLNGCASEVSSDSRPGTV